MLNNVFKITLTLQKENELKLRYINVLHDKKIFMHNL